MTIKGTSFELKVKVEQSIKNTRNVTLAKGLGDAVKEFKSCYDAKVRLTCLLFKFLKNRFVIIPNFDLLTEINFNLGNVYKINFNSRNVYK